MSITKNRIFIAVLTPVLAALSISANATFIVEQYDYTVGNYSLAALESYAASHTADMTENFDSIDFSDTGSNGNIAGYNLWPMDAPVYSGSGGVNDTFFLRVTGNIDLDAASIIRTWNDDGVYVRVDGDLVINDPTLHAPRNFFSSEISAGAHTLELYFFEHGGGANLELMASQGGAPYRLLTATETTVPEPGTLVLLGLGLAGLGFGRKSRAI